MEALTWTESTRVHLIGIGGIGVSGVARLLKARGVQVSGSDIRQSAITEALEREGIRVAIGHRPENVHGADVVVISTAIPAENAELIEAERLGLPIWHRARVLNAVIRDRFVIGVTGTHGKGTVSSMITWILECAGWQPGFFIGGMLNNLGTNARPGGGQWFVVEVDESDGTHHEFELDMVVCNFLEVDHLNYYKDWDDIIDTMQAFIEGNDRLKEAFIQLDCEGNRRMVERLRLRPTGYAMEHNAEFRAQLDGPGQLPIPFSVTFRDESLGAFELNLPGRYNVVNALAAIAVTTRLGVPREAMLKALSTYSGLENRFTIEQGGGVTVVKDYVSHPTGMRKVLESAQDLFTDTTERPAGKGRLISVFKPYRYTLTSYLQDEYGEAFEGSDEVIISTMYAANEDPIEGVDTNLVVRKIRDHGLRVTHIPDQGDITPYLLEHVRPGDKVIFFGGDDYFRMADAFVAQLAARAGQAAPLAQPGPVGGPLTTEEGAR